MPWRTEKRSLSEIANKKIIVFYDWHSETVGIATQRGRGEWILTRTRDGSHLGAEVCTSEIQCRQRLEMLGSSDWITPR